MFIRSEKFFVVGLLTKNLGGYRNNSSIGLKAWQTRYTRGRSDTSAPIDRNIVMAIAP
jgi:hypothetical protein